MSNDNNNIGTSNLKLLYCLACKQISTDIPVVPIYKIV